MTKNYRIWSEADLPAVLEILRSSESDLFGKSGRWTPGQLQTEFQAGHGWVGVAPDGLLTCFLAARELGHGEWEVMNLAVLKRFQRRGWMEFLLGAVLAPIAGLPAHRVFLEVHEKNIPAQALYAKVGFQFSGRRKKYYPDGGDALLFTLSKS